MTQTFYLAVDGGGTHCRIRLEDAQGQILGEGMGGPANIGLGVTVVMAEINRAVSYVVQRAGLPLTAYDQMSAVFGLAGLIDQTEIQVFLEHPHPYGRLCATSDAVIACLGAHDGLDGGICILGTGSVACYGQQGAFQQLGGWGFELADQGSGAWVGLRALQISLQAADGMGPSSMLTERILSHFDQQQANMVRWARSATPASYGTFAPWVVEAAEQGDELAEGLMQQAAQAAEQLLTGMWQQGCQRLCLMGGFASSVEVWLSEAWRARLSLQKNDAVMGAMMLARQPELLADHAP